MIIGVVLCSDDASTGDVYYSPWFPRGGNRAVFSCEVIAKAAASAIDSFTIQVQTKNAEDSDKDAVDLGSPNTISLASDELLTSFEAGAKLSDGVNQGMKALVRLEYTVKAEDTKHAWVHFRMLNPAWLAN